MFRAAARWGCGKKSLDLERTSTELILLSPQKKFEGPNVRVLVGDQGSPAFWASFRQEVPRVDILIDDGGHTIEQMKTTLLEMLPHLSKTGVYMTEDIHGDDNPMWNFLTDQFMHEKQADLIRSIHVYPYLMVLERSPVHDKASLEVGMGPVPLGRSAFCSQDMKRKSEREELQRFIGGILAAQVTSNVQWPCLGSVKDLHRGAALFVANGPSPTNFTAPWSSRSGALLKKALSEFPGWNKVQPGALCVQDKCNASSTHSQNVLDSIHVFPELIVLKRFAETARDISAPRHGDEWISYR